MPERFAKIGDPHAGIDDAPLDITPLLEMVGAGRTRTALGDMPYPPEHPKMPGEPPRVQPSRARNRNNGDARDAQR